MVNKRQLKGFSDETLIRFMIQMARDRFDPMVNTKPTLQDAEWTVAEVLLRMGTGSIICPNCDEQTKAQNYCSYCGNQLT